MKYSGKRLSGLLSERPAATAAVDSIYYATDTELVYKSAGGNWVERPNPPTFAYFNGLTSVANKAALPDSESYLGWAAQALDTNQWYEGFRSGWAPVDVGGGGGTVYAASIEVVPFGTIIKSYYTSVSADTGNGAGKPLFVAPVAATVKKVSVSYLSNDGTGSAYDEIELDFGTIDTESGQLQDNGFSISWSPESNTGVSSAGSSLASVQQGNTFGVGFLTGNSTSLANSAYKGLVATVFFEDA